MHCLRGHDHWTLRLPVSFVKDTPLLNVNLKILHIVRKRPNENGMDLNSAYTYNLTGTPARLPTRNESFQLPHESNNQWDTNWTQEG